MQYNVFGSKHRSNVQGNEASIVEFGNKHGNRDEFPDFVGLFIFGIKNVRVGRSETYFFFGLMRTAHSWSMNYGRWPSSAYDKNSFC